MKFINDFLENRTVIFEIFIVAIIIALGINFVSTGIYDILNHQNKNMIFIMAGLLFIFTAMVYLIFKLVSKTKIQKTFEGFILIDGKNKLPIDCDGYNYLEELNTNFIAAFSENKALEHIWMNKSITRKDKDALIIEATEYYLIDELSTHLTDYFNTRNLNKDQLIELSRNNIPDILLTNRFLELFSKPMNQRSSFIKDMKNDDDSIGKIVMSMGKDGSLFKEFDLVLPKNTIVSRNGNKIIIDTKRFKLFFEVDYYGFATVLPRGFEFYYLGYKNYNDTSCRKINVNFSVEFKKNSLISNSGWDYYEWIELFFEKIENNFSMEYFFTKINWNQIYTQTKINEQIIQLRNKDSNVG
ncbi:hypothetical protein [Cloacibacterium sp.]|uniref:hypothetical protein n=1 Tax=Cloacibacterium sp. TaxID=1913682 RepID=UPI0039E24B37